MDGLGGRKAYGGHTERAVTKPRELRRMVVRKAHLCFGVICVLFPVKELKALP